MLLAARTNKLCVFSVYALVETISLPVWSQITEEMVFAADFKNIWIESVGWINGNSFTECFRFVLTEPVLVNANPMNGCLA